jgi:hypothetical protein
MGENQGALAAHCIRFVPIPFIHAVPLTQNVVVPVNSVSWAPHELGAILACASSDGKISVLTFKGVVFPLWTTSSPPNLTEPKMLR